ncbi:LysR family transcriptional regulator [Sphingobium sp. AN641]|uniref:LysR family transcriptional regulator n=1 Tax=Sphingobium sp. AN641 TaxID=3133443 RepID=UPI0030C22ED9
MLDPDYALFAAIAEEGGLSAAARRLAISPAMVSKRLVRLEARLGARLVHRTTRRLALTPAGECLFEDLRAILSALDDAERRVTGAAVEASGLLTVTAPTSFGRMHVAPHLGRFLDAYPLVTMRLDLSDEFADLIESRADVAVRIAADPGAGLTAHRLATNRRILCASPAYLARAGMPASIADLEHHRLLAAQGQLPWRLTGPRGGVNVDGTSHVRTNSSEVARELALAGVGIALRSLWDVSDALADGRLLQILPAHEGLADVALFAVHLPQPRPPLAVTAFIAFLQHLYAPAPPWERPAIAPAPQAF